MTIKYQPKFLPGFDLQAFSSDEFDLDTMRADFEKEWTDAEPDEPEEIEETDELEDPEEPEEDLEEEPEEDLEEPEEDLEDPEEEIPSDTPEPKKQSKEENAAFAQLRREKEQLAEQNKVLEQVASQYGMTVEQFQEAYQQKQEEQTAETQGIPVETFRELNNTKSRLATLEKERANEKFNQSVQEVKDRYGLADQEVTDVFDYIQREGLHNPQLGLPTVPFEHAYKALNFDNMLKRKTTESKQKALADKKKRQRTSAKPHGSNVSTTKEADTFTDEEVFESLRKRGLI